MRVIDVSIVIPAYNSEKYIKECLSSALAVSGIAAEIIVVDDGSTDSTHEILSQYPSIQVFKLSHSGACRARNHGISNATGEFIKFLDSDDLIDAENLGYQVSNSRSMPPMTLVYSDIQYFNCKGRFRFHKVKVGCNENQILELLRCNLQTSATLYRREALLKVGGFDERLLKAQEYNLNLRLALAGYRFHRVSGVACSVREHDSPHRISNQISEFHTENSKLRSQIYYELLRKHYGSSIPVEIRRHFVSSTIERVLVRLRRLKIEGAASSVRYMLRFDPTVYDLLHGIGTVVAKGLRSKLKALRRRNSFS